MARASTSRVPNSAEKADRRAALEKLRLSRAAKLEKQKIPESKLKVLQPTGSDSDDKSSSEDEKSARLNRSTNFRSPPKKINDFTKAYNRYNAEDINPLHQDGESSDSDVDFIVADGEVEYEEKSDSDSSKDRKKSASLKKKPAKKATPRAKRKLPMESGSESEAETPQLKKKRCGKIVLEDSDDSLQAEKPEEIESDSDDDPNDFFPSDSPGKITPEDAHKTRLQRKKHSSSSSETTSSSESDDLYQGSEDEGKRVSVRARKIAVRQVIEKEKFDKLKREREEKRNRKKKSG